MSAAPSEPHWHDTVTQEFRNHLIGKLVKAVIPSPDPNAMLDQRMKDLVKYAKTVEKHIYDIAMDTEEYYHMLAEKIYKIETERQRQNVLNNVDEKRADGPAQR